MQIIFRNNKDAPVCDESIDLKKNSIAKFSKVAKIKKLHKILYKST